jgi:hypothetical protein
MLKALAGTIIGLLLVSTMSCLTMVWYGGRIWQSPDRQRQECAVGAEIALTIMRDRVLMEPVFKKPIYYFAPKLIEPSNATSLLPLQWLSNLRWNKPLTDFVLGFTPPKQIDCKDAFREQAIPTKQLDINPERVIKPTDPWPELYQFSRIWLSSNGNEADLFVSNGCGVTCGSGWRTHWSKRTGKWQLTAKSLRWIS